MDVYPEIMVVVDSALQKTINKPEKEIIAYLRRFYSDVQNVYASTPQPRFHFSLSDIYFCKVVVNRNSSVVEHLIFLSFRTWIRLSVMAGHRCERELLIFILTPTAPTNLKLS